MKGNHQQRGKMIKKEELNGFISGIQDVGLLLTSITKPKKKKKKVGGKICTIEDGKTRFSYFIGQPDIQQKTTSKVQIKDGARTGPFSFFFFSGNFFNCDGRVPWLFFQHSKWYKGDNLNKF